MNNKTKDNTEIQKFIDGLIPSGLELSVDGGQRLGAIAVIAVEGNIAKYLFLGPPEAMAYERVHRIEFRGFEVYHNRVSFIAKDGTVYTFGPLSTPEAKRIYAEHNLTSDERKSLLQSIA